MNLSAEIVEAVRQAIDVDRLSATAVDLVGIPSPTCDATAVLNRLAELLEADGFPTERPEAGYAKAPAVAARFDSGVPGPVMQFNGHFDTVHLPFIAPRIENGILYGSGASDMKGGMAAALEAFRILKENKFLTAGSVLYTGHDLHEAPWGDGTQIDRLIEAGYVGDAVMLPEYVSDRLAVVGRGLAILKVTLSREGIPVHEVLGGMEQPSVIAAGAELITRINELDQQLSEITDGIAGRESMFIGEVRSGEIYNQAPTEFQLTGTRRWLPGTKHEAVKQQFLDLLKQVEQACPGITATGEFHFVRDAFQLDQEHTVVSNFQDVCTNVMGEPLPIGCKPFVDDGNTFSALKNIPAITHGPNAKGAHTVNEEVPIAELERVALVYALTAISFCNGEQ